MIRAAADIWESLRFRFDFSDLAQGCKTYDEFIDKMKEISETELNYFGIAICGAKKKVNKLTGSMALLR